MNEYVLIVLFRRIFLLRFFDSFDLDILEELLWLDFGNIILHVLLLVKFDFEFLLSALLFGKSYFLGEVVALVSKKNALLWRKQFGQVSVLVESCNDVCSFL